MQRCCVLMHRETGELDGVIVTNLNNLDDLDCNREIYHVHELTPDHPIQHEPQQHYQFCDGQLVKKSQIEIDRLIASAKQDFDPRRGKHHDVLIVGLLKALNATRQAVGLPTVTIEELRDTIMLVDEEKR